MANDDQINARGGLIPIQQPYGTIKVGMYRLGTADTATPIFRGMPVDLDANGFCIPIAAAQNTFLVGSILGWTDSKKAGIPSAQTTLQQGGNLPANTDAWVYVADDPNQEFYMQEDTGGSALTAGNIGNTGDFIYRAGSGNTTTGWASAEADRSTFAANTGGVLYLLGLYENMNSDGTDNAYGNYGKLRLKIQRHRLGAMPGSQNQ